MSIWSSLVKRAQVF